MYIIKLTEKAFVLKDWVITTSESEAISQAYSDKAEAENLAFKYGGTVHQVTTKPIKTAGGRNAGK